MAIKAEFLTGQTEKRLSPLYQWDYGQTLEIEAPNLPTIIEVHFACPAMTEAVVHTCSCVNGVAAVAIPDQCLEQEREITAWVYEVEGTSGRTLYRVFIPIIARTRPSRGESIPVEVQDPYTQLITEVNEAVGKIANGDIMVGHAAKATSADRATQADNASSAAHATSADRATQADSATMASYAPSAMSALIAEQANKATLADSATNADLAAKATKDGDGRTISTTYLRVAADFIPNDSLQDGVYQFAVGLDGPDGQIVCCAILPIISGTKTQASLGAVLNSHYVLRCDGNGRAKVLLVEESKTTETYASIYARQIFNW